MFMRKQSIEQSVMLMTKPLLTKILPSKYHGSLKRFVSLAKAFPKLILNYIYDFRRFLQFSAVGEQWENKIKHRALITKEYHRIEKGLALKEPRVGFGLATVQGLLSSLRKYQGKYGIDQTAQNALNTLFTYYHFNLEHGFKDEQLYQALVSLRDTITEHDRVTNQGGILKVSKQSIHEVAKLDLRDFFKCRYSVRHFAREEVDINLIQDAVAMAQKTPSVCNRQSWKVYVFSGEQAKKKVLSYQNGNRGFGDQASKVLVVTSELNHFFTVGERNQCWIDGGMFCMSLVYALHSLGLGTCCLNWSVESKRDQELKRATEISDSESIIMLIAVGYLPDELKVAQSPRKKICEVMFVK